MNGNYKMISFKLTGYWCLYISFNLLFEFSLTWKGRNRRRRKGAERNILLDFLSKHLFFRLRLRLEERQGWFVVGSFTTHKSPDHVRSRKYTGIYLQEGTDLTELSFFAPIDWSWSRNSTTEVSVGKSILRSWNSLRFCNIFRLEIKIDN